MTESMDEWMAKPKKKRSKPNKKWTMEEEEKIGEFLKDEQAFEKPTAQIFYRKFIEKSPQVNTTWNLLRWKVRNMKHSYVKAEDWRKSTGAGLLESESEKGLLSVKAKLVKMCPHYEMLHEIFGAKSMENTIELQPFDTADTIFIEDNTNTADFDCSERLYSLLPPSSDTSDSSPAIFISSAFCTLSDPQEPSTHSASRPRSSTPPAQLETSISAPNKASSQCRQNVHSFVDKLKKGAPKTGLSQLSQIQIERTDIQRRRLELEKEKLNNDILIDNRKLAIEEERFQAELEFKKEELNLKRLELEKDERLKKMELGYKERIAMYELELKYNVQKE